MGKNVNLTEKLGMSGNPTITVQDKILTVNDSAKNVLHVMEILGNDPEHIAPQQMFEAANCLFDERSNKAIAKMELSFADYMTLIEAALDLVLGDVAGEAVTLATTS